MYSMFLGGGRIPGKSFLVNKNLYHSSVMGLKGLYYGYFCELLCQRKEFIMDIFVSWFARKQPIKVALSP